MATFGERLRELRDDRGLNQENIANILNVDRSTIAGYETRGRETSYSNLMILAELFDVSIDYLIGYSDVKNHGPRKIYAAEELIDYVPDGYKELFKSENLGAIEFTNSIIKEEINPTDLIELVKIVQNLRKQVNKEDN